jgi:hypothetical protein
MKSKSEKGNPDPHRLTMLRQLVGRNASRYSAGGREKRKLRREPSLPQLKCLENGAVGETANSRPFHRMRNPAEL